MIAEFLSAQVKTTFEVLLSWYEKWSALWIAEFLSAQEELQV